MRSVARVLTALLLLLAGLAASPLSAAARPPGAPASVTATPGDGSVKVAWKAPSATGGKAITAYRVQRQQGSTWRVVATTAGSARSTVVTGLTNGARATFRVVAVNRDGAGTPSKTASATPRTTPSAPRSVAAEDRHEGARVTWAPPQSTGGAAISGYVIQAAQGSGNFRTVGSAGASATSKTITGLTNGQTYRIRVAALNAAGTGAYSAATASMLLPSALSVSVGTNHACAVTPGHTVVCWGRNNAGQIGNGELDAGAPTPPTEVPDLTDVISVTAMADYSCAVTSEGTVWCWGTYGEGVLGSNPGAVQTSPIEVPGITDAIAVSGDQWGACALRAGGTVRCWGTNVGHLGLGTSFNILQTVGADTDVVGITGGVGSIAQQITVGEDFACARLDGPTGICWGSGFSGGTGSTSDTLSAQAGAFPSGQVTSVSDISSGFGHTCAVDSTGQVFCWGGDGHGKLGDGTIGSPSTDVAPQPVGDIIATDVAAGATSTCAITTDSTVFCWGQVLGSVTDSATAVAVTGTTGTASIDLGSQSACIVRTDGTPRCWGDNAFGQLGDGGTTDSTTPIRPTSL